MFFRSSDMKKFTSPRLAAPLAAAFLICAVAGLGNVAHAQTPPCASCLQPAPETNQWFCSGGCPGCYSWLLTNTCNSCITSITLNTKSNLEPFTACCAVIMDPTHETWTATQNDAYSVTFTADSGSCLAQGQSLQVTTCGLTTGNQVYMTWAPADPPCTNNSQDELILVP